jgi:hypothetical protein
MGMPRYNDVPHACLLALHHREISDVTIVLKEKIDRQFIPTLTWRTQAPSSGFANHAIQSRNRIALKRVMPTV